MSMARVTESIWGISKVTALVVGCVMASGGPSAAQSALEKELATLKIPPDWFAEVQTNYDTRTPWKQARLDIRKMLDEHRNREAIKLTYTYIVVDMTAPDDHEYGMYTYLGNEFAWGLKVYSDRIAENPDRETIAYTNLAAIYLHFGEPKKALAVLRQGLQHLPKPPWNVPSSARVYDRIGDVHGVMGEHEQARIAYREAMKIFPTSKQPYGRQNLPKEVSKIQGKLDLLGRDTFDFTTLGDGTFQGQGIGYAGKPVRARVTVRDGRILTVGLQHQERIEQWSTKTVPKQIIERQSLKVDAVTGATVTVQAIVEATYRAVRKAGFK